MKVLKATVALASVLAFSSAYAVEAAPSQPSVDGSSVNSQTVQQHSEIKKDSKGVIKKKKSTVEEQNMNQQALPESQQPAAGK
ncbi:hypothetical protein [Bdellovibrio sp. KM01]|uniref:hypothetical protein n=1 Tax=Bdellovibrio sp. KM01 TaxID=2748865 RepID=UPI0015E94D31|nr:hypothetical protein [Bdellovibrio sp. KM01]QLY24265.1 hypothetical protein HW988_12410 [Bdellovibrio sp. KM01]